MATAELEIKTQRLQQMLDENGLGGILLNTQHNFAWLTAGGFNGVDQSRENGVASLLVTAKGKRYLLASNIEMPRTLAEEVSADDVEPFEFAWQDEKASASFLLDRARSLTDGEIAVDLTADALVAGCRYSLTDDEAERFRTLGADAAAAMDAVITKVEHGETEIAIAEKLRHELALNGMTSVVTLVAADKRISDFRHPVPTANRWEKTLLLVTCAKRRGLIASLSRLVNIGPTSDELRRKNGATAYVHAHLQAATKPGASGAELYRVAAAAYADAGFADEIDRHHQGGAAGYKTREWVAHPASREVARPQQAFAWNPSITGTKAEETMIITDTGVEVITRSMAVPQIETEVGGVTYFSPGIVEL